MNISERVQMRGLVSADVPFIMNSWLKSYRQSSAVRDIRSDIYFGHQHNVVEALLGLSSVAVACDPKEPSEVLGYIVYSHSLTSAIVHWCYVKSALRRLGIGSALMACACGADTASVLYSHKPKKTAGSSALIMKSKAVLNTYLAT